MVTKLDGRRPGGEELRELPGEKHTEEKHTGENTLEKNTLEKNTPKKNTLEKNTQEKHRHRQNVISHHSFSLTSLEISTSLTFTTISDLK